MDNSPSWDEPLAAAPEVSHRHLDRRDVRTVSAAQRPTTAEYRRYLGIVAALRDAGWDTEHQMDASPFAVEDPGFTAIAVCAADDLAVIAPELGEDAAPLLALAARLRAGLEALWDDVAGGYRAFDLRTARAVGPLTSGGAVAVWAGCDAPRAHSIADQVERWMREVPYGVASTDPAADTFDPVRYWRGPVWVLVNWMIADGLARAGIDDLAVRLRGETLALVAREGFCEYFDPRDGTGIGGEGFSWTAALTLAWLDP
jgi:glycogen debranching enzyme